MAPVRVAENLKLRAEAQLEASERALASASSAEAKEQAEDARAKAAALAIELSGRLDQRFRSSNHIRPPCRAYRPRCERRAPD